MTSSLVRRMHPDETNAEHEIEVGVGRIDDDRARRFLGVVIDQGATELRCQFLLRADLGPHVRRECGHGARVAEACNRPSHTRIVWSWTDLTRADRQRRPHRLLPNCILFGRTGWAGRDGAGHAVVGAQSGTRWLVILWLLHGASLSLVGWECGHVAWITLRRSAHTWLVWPRPNLTRVDRQRRPHRLSPNCILFCRACWAGPDGARHAVV